MKSPVELHVTGYWRDVDDAMVVIHRAFEEVEGFGCSYDKTTERCTEHVAVFQGDVT